MASYKQQLTLGCLLLSLCGLSAGSAVAALDDADCPTVCAAIYRPICGTDGYIYKEFANLCELKSSNCRRQRSALTTYLETDIAWCQAELVDNLHEKLGSVPLDANNCLKPCTMIYQPLCVTNGKYRATISNKCTLETFQCALQAAGLQDTLRVLQTKSC